MRNILIGSFIIVAGFCMMAYGVEHYTAMDNSFNNWLLSDGGIIVAFTGVVILGKRLIQV